MSPPVDESQHAPWHKKLKSQDTPGLEEADDSEDAPWHKKRKVTNPYASTSTVLAAREDGTNTAQSAPKPRAKPKPVARSSPMISNVSKPEPKPSSAASRHPREKSASEERPAPRREKSVSEERPAPQNIYMLQHLEAKQNPYVKEELSSDDSSSDTEDDSGSANEYVRQQQGTDAEKNPYVQQMAQTVAQSSIATEASAEGWQASFSDYWAGWQASSGDYRASGSDGGSVDYWAKVPVLEKSTILDDLPDLIPGLVKRIKSGQSNSDDFRSAWWKYCKLHGNGTLEPAAHAKDFLMRFLEGFNSAEDAYNDDQWASWWKWDARRSYRRRPAGDPEVWDRKLWVGSLPPKCTEAELQDYFAKEVGAAVEDAAIIVDKWNNSRGFGHVVFYDAAAVEVAKRQVHIMAGQRLNVDACKPHRDVNVSYDNPAADRHAHGAQDKKIFVGNLATWHTKETLIEHFSKIAPVEDAHVMCDRNTEVSRGFGFVFFKEAEGLQAALNEKGRFEIEGRVLNLDDCNRIKSHPNKYGDTDKKIMVVGLDLKRTKDELYDAFKVFGPVSEADITVDHQTGKSRGFGFVTFVKPEDVGKALEGKDKWRASLGKKVRIKRYAKEDR